MPESHTTQMTCAHCRLADLCLPNGLQKSEVIELAAIVKNGRVLQAGETLYWRGNTCQSFYAIKSGSFRSFVANAEGVEQTVGFCLPGELMGLDSLQHGQFTCSTVALETASVCELPLTQLNALCARIPRLQLQLMRLLGKEIVSDHDKILLGHRSAKQRMATFLLMLSQRYTALGFSSTLFNLTMSRYDIANFLGLTIETVSRQLAYLTQQGMITVQQRGIEITNIVALKALVNACPGHCLADNPQTLS